LIQLRAFLHNGRAIRLVIAFLIGLPFGVLAGKVVNEVQNVLPFLLFPLLVGAICALTVRARQPHPHQMSLGTGLLAWGGIGVALIAMTVQAALTPCTAGMCSSTTSSLLGSLLIFYLLLGLLPVTVGALLTSILLRRFRQTR
jgi:hypothetical protein